MSAAKAGRRPLRPVRRGRPDGPLARRRRRQRVATAMIVLLVNVAVWFSTEAWSVRALIAIVSVIAAPMLHTLLFRGRR